MHDGAPSQLTTACVSAFSHATATFDKACELRRRLAVMSVQCLVPACRVMQHRTDLDKHQPCN